MIDRIVLETIETEKISMETIRRIDNLKNQHWQHKEAEHLRWFKENINAKDLHLLMWVDDCLVAYLDLVHINLFIGEKHYEALGIGNVCVSLEKSVPD